MRRMCTVALMLLAASVARAQVAWVGAGIGTTWEYQPNSRPDVTFLHSSRQAPMGFLAFPVSSDTLFRLRIQDLPHDVVYGGVAWPGRLRALTAGIDYVLPDGLGQTVVSGGVGSYRLKLQAKQPPPRVEENRFGWYLGVGQWFTLTRRSRVTVELLADHTNHRDSPTILSATGGIAVSF